MLLQAQVGWILVSFTFILTDSKNHRNHIDVRFSGLTLVLISASGQSVCQLIGLGKSPVTLVVMGSQETALQLALPALSYYHTALGTGRQVVSGQC